MDDSITYSETLGLGDDSVASHSKTCLMSFSNALTILPEKFEHFDCRLTALDLRTIGEQFQIWTQNNAVFARDQACLDHQLEEAPTIKETITSYLQTINANLKSCLVLEPFDVPNDDDGVYTSSDSSDSESESSAAVTQETGLLRARYELDTRLEDVSDLIDKLSSIAKAIDKSGLSTRILKSNAYSFHEDEQNQLQLFETEYLPKLLEVRHGIKNFLQLRLSKAIAMRRRYFDHQLAHQQDSILAPIDTTKSESSFVALASLPITSFAELRSQSEEIPQNNLVSSNISSKSSKSSNSLLDLDDFPPPKENFWGEYTKCSYCCLLFPREKLRGDNWRKHVLKDLKPFICLAEQCDSGAPDFSNQDDWLEHHRQRHALQWWCEGDANHVPHALPNESTFVSHLRQIRPNEYREKDLNVIAKLAARPGVDPFTHCPLCSLEGKEEFKEEERKELAISPIVSNVMKKAAVQSDGNIETDIREEVQMYLQRVEERNEKARNTRRRLHKHMLRHLQSLFLYALPLRDDAEDTDIDTVRCEGWTVNRPVDLRIEESEPATFRERNSQSVVDLTIPDCPEDILPRLSEIAQVQPEDDKILVSSTIKKINQTSRSKMPSRSRYLVERPELRDTIRSALHDKLKSEEPREKIVVLHGPVGIGKTDATLDYINMFGHDYEGIIWIDGRNYGKIREEILHIEGVISEASFKLARPWETGVLSRILPTYTWTCKRDNNNWLWVFDSLDDPHELEAAVARITSVTQPTRSVHTIITTRCGVLTREEFSVEVSGLTQSQALSLFWTVSEQDEPEASYGGHEEAREVVDELDRSPFLVTVAGLFISGQKRAGLDLPQFLDRYRKTHQKDLSGGSLALFSGENHVLSSTYRTMEAAQANQLLRLVSNCALIQGPSKDWDIYDILGIDRASLFHCIGMARTYNRRCLVDIDDDRQVAAVQRLNLLTRGNTEDYMKEFITIATLLLCPKWHQDQARMIAEGWMKKIGERVTHGPLWRKFPRYFHERFREFAGLPEFYWQERILHERRDLAPESTTSTLSLRPTLLPARSAGASLYSNPSQDDPEAFSVLNAQPKT